jgi:hypothetical protein
LKFFKIALDSRRMRKGRLFAHLGRVINPDVCVLIADFFMRVNSVNWSIISGIYDKKLIVIFRNDGLRKNAGTVAQQSFGHIGSAGGHKSVARAEIKLASLKGLVEHRENKKILIWVINAVEKKAGKK